MRVKLVIDITKTEMNGITPAHAGKTLIGLSCQTVLKDHPRACG